MNLGQQQPSDVVRIEQYAKSLEQNTSNVLLDEDVNKLNFIRTTPYSADQWENYFDVTGRGYVDLKKRVRIAVALNLIKDEFLNTYSVEALSKEIGYKSRTSFYNCFEEITGSKFPEFRETLRKSQNEQETSASRSLTRN